MSKPMSALRFSFVLLLVGPFLGGCGDRYSTLPVPGVAAAPMPGLEVRLSLEDRKTPVADSGRTIPVAPIPVAP